MKKIKVNPLQARVKGNIIPDWEELLTKTSFEDFHVSREKANSITWKGREISAIRLNSRGEPVILTVMSDLTSILPDTDTATLTIHATYTTTENNQTMTYPVQYQQVYIYDEDKLIATGATNSLGVMTFEYESSFSGIHELTIKTNHGNGFESASRKINIYVKYTSRLELSPIYTYDLGFGEAKELVATLYDSDNNVVADKPITFYEGYRNLGTYTTDKDGKARVMYMESDNRGTPTSITLTQNPQFYDNVNSVVEGVLTTIDGTPLADKNVALFHEYNGHLLSFDDTDSDGRFSIRYGSLALDVPLHFYVVYRSRIMDSTNNEYVYYEPTFTPLGEKIIGERPEYLDGISDDTIITILSEENKDVGFVQDKRVYTVNNNLSSDTSVNPSITSNYYDCGVNTNVFQELPRGENWIIRLTAQITGNVLINYNNVFDGSITLENGNNGYKIYNNTSSYNAASTLGAFTDNTLTSNTLKIIRENNKITFQYTDIDGETVIHERTYTDLTNHGTLYIQTKDGQCKIYDLSINLLGEDENTTYLPIYDLNKWTVIPHATLATTENVWNDNGTLDCGRRQHNLYPMPVRSIGTQYDIYFYQRTLAMNLAVGQINNGVVNNKGKYTDLEFPDAPTDSINKYTISYENDGIYLSYGDESIFLTNRTTDTHLDIYTASTGYPATLLDITMTNGGGGNNE